VSGLDKARKDEARRRAEAGGGPGGEFRHGGPGDPGQAEVLEAADDPHRLARLFLASRRLDGLPTVRFWREQWYAWDGRAYRHLPDKELRAGLCETVKAELDRLCAEGIRLWREGDGHAPGARPPRSLAAKKVTTQLLANVAQVLASMTLLPSSVSDPSWLGGRGRFPADEVVTFSNTVVHLPSLAAGRDCRARLTPRLLTLNALGYPFDPNAPPPAAWLDFLGRLWPHDAEAVAALQEWFGYCLTGDTRQHKILLLLGPTRSGKGTIGRVLRALLGPANCCAPTLSGLGTNFGLQELIGKTLAVVSDARISGRSDLAAVTERLLSISGEDPQTIDRKYLPAVTLTLAARFVVLTNELPRLTDPSGALAGRLVILRLTESWYGREDTGLKGRLLAELPGIFLWAVEGYRRLRERGHFRQPASSEALVEEMHDLSSPVGAFVRERCNVGPEHEAAVADVFAAWQRWCESKGRRDAGTEQTFGRDLRAVLPHLEVRNRRTDDGRARTYAGLALAPEVPW
jgi:putative DNA primase/helicase